MKNLKRFLSIALLLALGLLLTGNVVHGLTPTSDLGGCGCGSPPYICWYYAMQRAGYSPDYCPNAINSSEFGSIDKAYMPSADIIDWGGHAGYIKSSTSSSVTVDEYNRGGTCSHLYNQVYSYPSWGGASRGWVRRPAKVSLSSPSNGAQNVNPSVLLDWNTAARADKYWLQVATNSNFTNLVYDNYGNETSSTSKSLSLSASTTYYWRVKSMRGPYGTDKIYSTPWSPTWSFSTSTPCSSVGTPSINSTIYQGHPKIYWSSVSGADKYKIYHRYSTPSGTFYYAGETTQTNWVDWNNYIYAGSGFKLYVYYKVKAVNNGPSCSPPYESSFSNYRQFTCAEDLW